MVPQFLISLLHMGHTQLAFDALRQCKSVAVLYYGVGVGVRVDVGVGVRVGVCVDEPVVAVVAAAVVVVAVAVVEFDKSFLLPKQS